MEDTWWEAIFNSTHKDGATKVLQELPDSEARDMLQVLAEDIVARKQ